MNYDVEVDWLLNEYCNFNCSYFFDSSNKTKKYEGDTNTQKVADGFNNKVIKFLVQL
jgi:uncharacterized protein YutD